MNKEVLSRKIKRAGDEIRRLERDIIVLQSVDVAEKPENYSTLSMEAAIKGEYLALKLRELVHSTTNIPKTQLLVDTADNLGILIDYDHNGIVEITIPTLIPKRKKKPADFITAPLFAALDSFIVQQQSPPLAAQPFQRFKECVICITHFYNKDLLANGRHRDYDNIELKSILDTINTFLLTDDNGILCDIFNTSIISDMDFTRITIMPRDVFPEWILRHEIERKLLS